VEKFVIALVGEPLAGKGTLCSRIKSYVGEHRFSHICTGDILRDILAILHEPKDRQNCDKLVSALTSTFGKDVIARAVENRIRNDPASVIVFDCMRMAEDEQMVLRLPVKTLRTYVTASPDIRFARLQQRKRGGEESISRPQFDRDEQLPTVQLTRSIGQRANVKLENDDDYDKFDAKIIEFCQEFLHRYRCPA
jgi:dephospho-CoA kinase